MKPEPGAQAARERRRDTPLRRARTCYGHLAGVAGVALLEQLLERGWLATEPPTGVGERLRYRPTAAGAAALASLGVELPTSSAAPAYACLDWTERPRHHLGGSLGASLVRAFERQGRLHRVPGSRAVAVDADLL